MRRYLREARGYNEWNEGGENKYKTSSKEDYAISSASDKITVLCGEPAPHPDQIRNINSLIKDLE